MANLKLIVVTGKPFSDICVGCIGIQTDPETFQIIRDGRTYTQYASSGDGYRLATKEDIEKNWSTIYPHWTPEPGDNVIITENYGDWANKEACIVGKNVLNNYWNVLREDGATNSFDYAHQMILAPYVEAKTEPKPEVLHGFKVGDRVLCTEISGPRAYKKGTVVHLKGNIGVSYDDYCSGHDCNGYCPAGKGWYSDVSEIIHYIEPEKPLEETVSIKFLTEQQFINKGLWRKDHPKGWNSMGEMNKYLGLSVVIPKSSIGSDGSFKYEDWTFKETDYIVTEWIPSKVDDSRDVSRTIASSGITFKSVVTPIPKAEKPLRRFKVGDKVTYKSRAECGGMYRYGGEDQEGFVGTVESERSYDLERSCYDLKVTTKEGDFCYTMLESEFYEYDSGYIPTTSRPVGSSEPATRLVIKGAVATIDTDPLSLYKQKPITIKSKPKSKLTTI